MLTAASLNFVRVANSAFVPIAVAAYAYNKKWDQDYHRIY